MEAASYLVSGGVAAGPTAGGRAEALIAGLGGQKSVAAAAKRAAGVRGDLDHFGALGFLQGPLAVLRDCGRPGLLLVLDEVETLPRVRGDVRAKSLDALRQFLDEIDAGRFPGLFLVITGPPPATSAAGRAAPRNPSPSGWRPASPPTRASPPRARYSFG